MCYETERVCEADEVILAFLKIESQKPGDVEFQNLLREVRAMRGDQLKTHVRRFAERTRNGSPIFPWTVGINGDERRRMIRRWIYADIPLEQLYTCGINPSMEPLLMKARGNLKAFLKYAPLFDELKLDWVPPESLRVAFGIARLATDKDGTIELIDGAHRTIPMLQNKITRSKALIGEM